ncbi:hypothetical protein A1O1_08200 [Capronia coronata CBS 617.96]|uniref:CWH43-like N-terminal domain-containing protein n=1 Tax=Capronia coronata CBS 617.96 TaxID=1182541 RepID=W9XYS3_9EURO|nr:uncharacterized protein A1O1_08200 [Capronia coronata CBS 617.96]EXJ82131.1 hypothetical protein A1O1_08200 [Capronia coronata CBS 617.96]
MAAELGLKKKALLRYLWLFPLIAGTSWGLTLSILLIYWLAQGRPRYPDQWNPYVAYISNIAAFELKPVFITGCTITAVSFALTVVAVHYARYSSHLYGLVEDAKWKKSTSVFAMLCGLWASLSLLLLTIYDTYHAADRHRILLLSCFAGLGITLITTGVVWFDQTWGPSRLEGLRKWLLLPLFLASVLRFLKDTETDKSRIRCIASNVLVVVIVALATSFTVLLYNSWWKTARILEWVLTYMGAFWLLTFIGYLKDVNIGTDEDDLERRPLLVSDDGE